MTEQKKEVKTHILYHLRREYKKDSFNEYISKDNPFEQFEIWFKQVLEENFLEPNAMVLSTATKEGIPSARVVLLKRFDKEGFIFFTNYNSQKGREIDENPNASLLFYWDKLERQVRINGLVVKIQPEESDEYFQTRPYLAKIGVWASKQSEPLKSRFALLREVVRYSLKFPHYVPLPPFWGGYKLIPYFFEFWQGRKSRLHDRISYRKNPDGSWTKQRLSP